MKTDPIVSTKQVEEIILWEIPEGLFPKINRKDLATYINLMLIKENKILFIRRHYRKAIKIIDNPNPKMWLDGGYIVIDFDNNILIDKQDCFSLEDLSNKELKIMKPLL